MRSVLQALQDLQEVDRDIFRVQTELKRLPLERAVRKAELDKQVTRIAERRHDQKGLRVRVKEFEDTATVARQRVRKIENEASTNRTDMALLAAYQHEIKTLKRTIGNAEEEGLALLEKIDVIENECVAMENKLVLDQKVFAEFSGNVEREMADAGARYEKLDSERKKRLGSNTIPAEALSKYTRLLAAREGVAIAQLEGRTCQACYIEIPTNLCVRVSRGSELVQCPSCDRILHVAS